MNTPHLAARSFLLLLAALAALLHAAPAAANLAAVQRNPSSLSTPATLRPTPLEVTAEQLRITCDEVDRAPRCTFHARYTLRNPTDAPQEADAAFYGLRTEGVTLRLDGQPVQRDLSEEEQRALDRALPFWDPVLDALGRELGETRHGNHNPSLLSRTGARFTLPPQAAATLDAEGVLLPGRLFRPSYAIPPVEARHLLLNTRLPDADFDLDYLLGPIKSWAAVGPVEIQITYPARWAFQGTLSNIRPTLRESAGLTTTEAPPPAWTTSPAADERATATATLDGAALADVLSLRFTVPGRPVSFGGALLGIGGDPGDRGGLRLRLGATFAGPDWLLYGLSLDTDLSDLTKLTPLVEVASPQVLILPSLSLGLGAPVILTPDLHVGARLQGTLHFALLGFALAVDAFPSLAGDPDLAPWQLTLMGQLSL